MSDKNNTVDETLDSSSEPTVTEEPNPHHSLNLKVAEKDDEVHAEPIDSEQPTLEDKDSENRKKTEDEKKDEAKETSPEKPENEEEPEAISTCAALKELEHHLSTAPAPLLKKDYVLVHREDTLALIKTLVELCEDDTLQDLDAEDSLLDQLAGDCDDNGTVRRPLSEVKKRAQKIIQDANSRANDIMEDAKILSYRLISDTEKEIQERYEELDNEINARLNVTREESSKHLTEARDNLTEARRRSQEILDEYLNKAEMDYEGYWERAERTLKASYEKSEVILGKACDIYQKELDAIEEDLATIKDILNELSLKRPY